MATEEKTRAAVTGEEATAVAAEVGVGAGASAAVAAPAREMTATIAMRQLKKRTFEPTNAIIFL